jgi:hypothetical protein
VEKLFEAKLIEEGVDDGQRPERFGNESRSPDIPSA